MNLPENYLDDNNLFYYRKCYQHFTMKYSLKKIEQQTEQQTEALKARLNVIDTFEDDVDVPKRSSHSQQGSGSNNQAILPKEFILCKRNKYVKRRLQGLITCAEMRATKLIVIIFILGYAAIAVIAARLIVPRFQNRNFFIVKNVSKIVRAYEMGSDAQTHANASFVTI